MDILKVFKALSNENRLEIIEFLGNKSVCACKLIEEFNLSQSTISHHMKILLDSDLVKCEKKGKWHHYSINLDSLKIVKCYFEDLIQNKDSNHKEGEL